MKSVFVQYQISVIFTKLLTYIYLFADCPSTKADVLFLLDASYSMRSASSGSIVPFISNFASSVVIGPQNVFIGVVSSARPYFKLGTYTRKEKLVQAIETIR